MTDFEHIDAQFIDTLELTGIIDAYEYVLRKLIQESLPKEEVYEKCARYLLEYKKLLLENNIRAKKAKSFYELSNLDTGKKEEKKIAEIIPTFPVTLKSKLLLEQEENKTPQKIFETNIDELIKNRLNLLSKKAFNEENRSNLQEYGTFATYVENENEKSRMYDFKIKVKFDNFEFTSLEDIEKENPIVEQEEIKTEVSKKSSKKSTQRRNTGKSVESGSESIQSKSVTPSEASKIKKETEDVVDELFNNYKKEFE